jgi:DNA-binding NarL/FixJ family response regulator
VTKQEAESRGPDGGVVGQVQGVPVDRGEDLTVVLVDESELFRDLLRYQLEVHLPACVVRSVASVEGVARFGSPETSRYCILLGSVDGVDRLSGRVAALRRDYPAAFIAVLPNSPTAELVQAAMKSGACGVVPKSFSRGSFLAALVLILSGEAFVPWELRSPSLSQNLPKPVLTTRESQVLDCLGEGMSNKAIAESLSIREVTAKLHARSLFNKLNVRNRTQAVRQAIRMGLLD